MTQNKFYLLGELLVIILHELSECWYYMYG